MPFRQERQKIFDFMKRYYLILAAAFAATALSCTNIDRAIENDIEVAKAQLADLVKASTVENDYLIPSSYIDGKIVFVPEDDWVSGFFAGSLWYMYELTGDEKWAEDAVHFTEKLDTIQYLKWHHDIGFMINDSYGNGYRLKNIEPYRQVLINAAQSLATRFRPVAGIIQSWNVVNNGWQSERGWECPVIIDNMMNLDLFFDVTEMTGDSTYFNLAVSHADKTLENHFREDNSCFHVVDYSLTDGSVRRRCTAQGAADDSSWARGQAWAIYGYTNAYMNTGYQRYLDHAKNVAAFILNHPNLPEDMVPYWDFDRPGEYRDVSSAAIIASALYRLYSITGDKSYFDAADKMILSLSKAPYLAEPGTNGGFLLKHSVGSIPHGSYIDVPLNYADYYFLEALIRRKNL